MLLIFRAAILLIVAGCSGESAQGILSSVPSHSTGESHRASPDPLPAAGSAKPVVASGEVEFLTAPESSNQTGDCADPPGAEPTIYAEPAGRQHLYSVDGYLMHTISVTSPDRDQPADTAPCIAVLWPRAETNSDGMRSNVAHSIGEPWFQLIRNTLARIPREHAATLRRIVIDNRPKEHGIAPHDRQDPDDGRDGHTVWLHEHLFMDPNHWALGTRGSYFSYHLSENDRTLEGTPPDHVLFSPVLLHEIAHLVMYNVVNAAQVGRARAIVPECAKTCVDAGDCGRRSAREREAGCITPYCTPFRYRASTENWAEQYRFYYQSSTTRALLQRARAGCLTVLAEQEQNATGGPLHAPWNRGLPDGPAYHRSLWSSCGGSACKPW